MFDVRALRTSYQLIVHGELKVEGNVTAHCAIKERQLPHRAREEMLVCIAAQRWGERVEDLVLIHGRLARVVELGVGSNATGEVGWEAMPAQIDFDLVELLLYLDRIRVDRADEGGDDREKVAEDESADQEDDECVHALDVVARRDIAVTDRR